MSGGRRRQQRRGEHEPQAQQPARQTSRRSAAAARAKLLADLHRPALPYASLGITSKSVRRFFARPSSVSLLATGLSGPLPTTMNLSRGKPYFATRKSTTDCARACGELDVHLPRADVVGVAADADVGRAEGLGQLGRLLEHGLGVGIQRRDPVVEVDADALGDDRRLLLRLLRRRRERRIPQSRLTTCPWPPASLGQERRVARCFRPRRVRSRSPTFFQILLAALNKARRSRSPGCPPARRTGGSPRRRAA